jgi:hypothetical protein
MTARHISSLRVLSLLLASFLYLSTGLERHVLNAQATITSRKKGEVSVLYMQAR